jgi:xanthine/uracil permease
MRCQHLDWAIFLVASCGVFLHPPIIILQQIRLANTKHVNLQHMSLLTLVLVCLLPCSHLRPLLARLEALRWQHI